MMKTSRVTIAYIASLIVLCVLLYLTFVHPMFKGREYSAIQNESLTKTAMGWTLQLDLTNPFPKATAFEISVKLNGSQPYTQDVTIPAGHSYGFMMPISGVSVKKGSKLQLDVYSGQTTTPFEQETLDLNTG
jgi:hypothetical protein